MKQVAKACGHNFLKPHNKPLIHNYIVRKHHSLTTRNNIITQ